jgi:hypothetical protein
MNMENQASFAALAPFVRSASWPGDGSVVAVVEGVHARTRVTASQGWGVATRETLLRRAVAGLVQRDEPCAPCRAYQHGVAAIAARTWTSVDDGDAGWLALDAGTSLAVAASAVQALREHALAVDGHEIALDAAAVPAPQDEAARLAALRADVLAGRWPAYSVLPSDLELAMSYVVRPAGVRQVVAGLVAEHVLLEAAAGRSRVVDRSRGTGLEAVVATAAALSTADDDLRYAVRVGRRMLTIGGATVVLDGGGLTRGVTFFGDRGRSRLVVFRNELPVDLDHHGVYYAALCVLIALAIQG